MKKKIIIGGAALVLLTVLFWWGGNAPSLHGFRIESPTPAETPVPTPQTTATAVPATTVAATASAVPTAVPKTEQPTKTAVPSAERKETASPSQEKAPEDGYACTISVRCDTLVGNLEGLKPEKRRLVPSDGVLLPETEAVFYEGETVFHLLLREMKRNKIHMEYVSTPIYHSAYIEGIGNFYEFDCGELSGWMYRVNGVYPNHGCSSHPLQEGDRVEWVYTCDFGKDVGGEYAAENRGNRYE